MSGTKAGKRKMSSTTRAKVSRLAETIDNQMQLLGLHAQFLRYVLEQKRRPEPGAPGGAGRQETHGGGDQRRWH